MDSNITIIGAGMIGLSVAARLPDTSNTVYVIEKHKRFGQESSSRNSEVVHSGIYYPHGSLKARLCVAGRELLYQFCRDHDIRYNKCGKLIVATDRDEVVQLPGILEGAKINGVHDARMVTRDEIRELEPHIRGVKGIYFPSTGIVDTYGLMKQLEGIGIRKGVNYVYGAEVLSVKRIKGGYTVSIRDADGEDFLFSTEKVINAAGLNAHLVAKSAGIQGDRYRVHYWKGEYFSVGNKKHKLIGHLIYPVPEANTVGLGIHATLDLEGRLKLGPNTIYLSDNKPDYSVNASHSVQFYRAARKYLPFLEPEDLTPDQAGVRPKLQKPGDPVRDFLIRDEKEIGYPGFVNLIGIESPGLTACLSIADYVSRLIHAD